MKPHRMPAADHRHRLPVFLQRFLAIRAGGMSHTLPLLCAMMAMAAGCAWMLGGFTALLSAMIAVVLMAAVSPVISPAMFMRLLRARPISGPEFPALVEMAGLLAQRAGFGTIPRLYLLPGRSINAITTGTDGETSIAISTGTIDRLSPRQIRAVLAHEIAHAWHGDTRILMLSDILYRATWTMALFALALFVFGNFTPPFWVLPLFGVVPAASFLLQRAVIRDREFAADHGASDLLNGPEDMIDALLHIDRLNRGGLNLLPYRSMRPSPLLDTHPPLRARIAALRALRPGSWENFFANRP